MLVYILILFVLFFLGLWNVVGALKNNGEKLLYYYVLIIFWFLSFLRWETGTDWESYLTFFNKNYILDEFLSTDIEPFFAYLNYIVKQVTDQYWVLLMVIGALIYCLTGPTIYKYSPFPFISLLVYLMLRKADIFFVRESIAIALCFFSIRYIIKKQLWLFLLIILVASQFHRSVIVFLPAYWIYHLNYSFKKIAATLAIYAAVIVLIQSIMSDALISVSSLLGERFFAKTQHYIEDDADYIEGNVYGVVALLRGLLNRIIILFLLFYSYNKLRLPLLRGLINLYVVSVIIFITVYPISSVLSRLYNSYDMFCVLALPFIFKAISRKSIPIVYFLFYTYVSVRFVAGTLYGAYSYTLVPYKTILF